MLIVGFSPLTRIGLARVLSRLPEVGAVSAASSMAAVRFAARNGAGMAVVDQAADPGFTLVRTLSSGYSSCPVVVLLTPSSHADEDARFAFGQGAQAVALATASASYLHQVLAGVYLGVPIQSKGEASTGDQKRAHTLSQRETEILALIAEGMSSKSIAERLVVSVETVRSHAKNIIRKLEANGRAEAVSIAYRTGILDSDALPLA
ncbi:response regulator transcription factor [Kutzneria kofuensis]|uniref:DNA-binding NarL/FixJ family response regulator n=1 Tax=Kutzneria kofuensis TaxID=103725 RepID=A0A7W9KNA0_9PSEU|nr:response regulator transcription factor [Kutzneria kofuensis]MBB5895615.1 DNA-binding NarL/FixJ family response regulator [Kutzneria kofuensis]